MENAQPEPSMEEILASIRRIISEDEDDGGADAAKKSGATEKTGHSAPDAGGSPSSSDHSGGELSGVARSAPQPLAGLDRATPEASTIESTDGPTNSDNTTSSAKEADPDTGSVDMMKQNIAAAVEEDTMETIVDQGAADAASAAFDTLSQSVRVSDAPGRSLEDIVVEMLRPMVKDWLDANLPAIVEEKVEEEVRRVARRRR